MPSDTDEKTLVDNEVLWNVFKEKRDLTGVTAPLESTFEEATSIGDLFDSFERLARKVSLSLGLDVEEIVERVERKRRTMFADHESYSAELGDLINDQFMEARLQSEGVVQAMDITLLLESIGQSRRAIDGGHTELAAWDVAIASMLAIRLAGRPLERYVDSGYKHSVLAPAKKTEWHEPLIKAAKRELKAGTPERKIVGLMAAKFPSKSDSQIRRVLKEKGVLK